MRRLMRSGLMLAVTCLGLAAMPGAARATVFNVIPSDGVDAPVEEFTDQDELWAYTTADISGGLACVVPRPFLQTEEENSPVNCKTSKAWGVSFIPGGTSGIWPISQLSGEGLPEFLPFETGCARFVFEGTCEWQIGIDGTTTRSLSFTVGRCAVLECPTRLVPNASTLFKAGKTTAKIALTSLCNAFNALSAAQAAAEAKQYVDFLVAEGAAGGVVFAESFMLKEAGGTYAISLFKKLLTPPGVKLVGSAWASASGFILCAPGLEGTFEKILGDPPDPNFTSVAAPVYAELPPPGDALGADLVETLDHLNGDSEAMLHAYERYQGADAAGSERNVHRQAQAISVTAFDALGDTRKAIDLLRSVATRSETDPDFRDQLFSGDDFDAFDTAFDRIRTSGFTADEITQFHDEGFTDEEIGLIRDRYSHDLSDSGLTADSKLSDALRGLADGLEPTLEPTEAFARNASAVAGETNEPPVASFTATPASGLPPLQVQLTSTTASADGDTLGVTWDFGDGATGSGANATHSYGADGDYTVTQTVSDGYESASTTKTVSVGVPNASPVASFTATPQSGTVPLDVAFDASGSSDSDGSIASYAWTFGDGGEGIGSAPSHTYTGAGTYTVTLVVTDDDGATAQSTLTVTAGDPENVAPTAAFTATPTSGTAPLAVDFDAAASSDSDGTVTSYDWQFGDGASASGVAASHTYNAAGTYTASLAVTDDDGAVATATKTITVAEPGNLPPTASLTATPTSGDAPLDVTFDGSGSHDADGGIVSSTLDFGDGQSAGSVSALHTYVAVGTYTATLTVTDDDGATATATQTITVKLPNALPTASFTATPQLGIAPLEVAFDASESSDADGSIAGYAWNFGDGQTGSGKTVTHTFAGAPGNYAVVLTVTDDHGGTGETSRTIRLKASNHPPEPAGDELDVEGAGVIDALLNDLDPDQDTFEIVATGAPQHGTAACGRLGGCLYTAASGYEGPDSFTYRVRDVEGAEATATVTVHVTPPAATADVLRVRDDAAATPAGTAMTLHLLANDTGTGLTVTDWTDPQHGTVDCRADGTCEYMPAAGFSGSDGFSYTVQDETQTERSAEVHLTVAPATAGFAVKIAGAATPAGKASITQGDGATWSAAVAPSPAGVSADALAALPRPGVTAELKGPHTLKPGSVHTARGWSVDPGGGGSVHAHAGQDALLGEVSDTIPRPLPAISQGTGGDGHVPILVGSKVFAFFHHSQPTSVTCVDRVTGTLCPGYPKVTNQGTGNIPGPAAVVGSKLYVHLIPAAAVAGSVAQALYCWDTAKGRPCGLIVVDRLETTVPGGSAPLLLAGKIYLAGDGGRLFCVDPATDAACAKPSVATGLDPAVGGEYDIVGHGSRVYVSRLGSGRVACLDVATGTTCPGWSLPRTFDGSNLVNRHDATGKADGVCVLTVTEGTCIGDATPSASTAISGWPNSEAYYTITAEAETGTRTLVGTFNSGLGCWDWVTMAACAGGGYVDGMASLDAQGAPLPSAYGAAWDGACVVGLGDPGQVFTVDPAAGRSPCTTLSAGTEPRSIDLRDQRCDGTVGSAAWQQVALGDAVAGELASVTVMVRDAATGAVLATKDITKGALDLAAIDAGAHPAVTVEASAISVAGDPAWADAVPPRVRVLWKSDPKQLCLETTTVKDCVSPLAPIAISGQLDGSAVKDERTLDLLRAACPPELGALPDRTVAEQTLLSAVVTATDPNGGALKFALLAAPPGASIDPASGRFSWTPTEAQGPGGYDVKVRVADAGGLTDDGTFKVRVTEVNRPPELAPPADATVGTGKPFGATAVASDPDAPANGLAFSLADPPPGARIDRGSGAIAWPAVPSGAHALTVRVTDDGSPALSAERRFTVTGRDQGGTQGDTQQSTAADLVRACTARGVVLEDVVPSGARVRLIGVAEQRFAGRRVDIVFAATGKVVARPTVAPDGSFAATARLPARRLRNSNRARYEARIGSERSLKLKLTRRMIVTALRGAGGKVTIAGRVIGPLAPRARDRTIVLERRVTCTRLVTVTRLRPRPNGAFRVTVDAPAGQSAAVYRLRTKVRRTARAQRLSSTFTLPRAVNFR